MNPLGLLIDVDDSVHELGDVVVFGGDKHDKFPNCLVTVGAHSSNEFQLCVRGRIISDGIDNSGFSSYTLFHHCELEEGSPANLNGRLFEWTGIPRLIHPQTGVSINDWRSLHGAHSLSSVKLCTGHNSQRVAGVLHEVCAYENSDKFNIYGPHGETRHKYHGERDLLRIAGGGDRLCWAVKGVYEMSPNLLSGMWTKYENGVVKGDVLMTVNGDYSFTIHNEEDSLSRLRSLEQKISLLVKNSM